MTGVPLDSRYTNTLYFNDATSQLNYFNSKVVYTFDNYTYQRSNRGVIRISVGADRLYSCNYLMYRNSNYTNKWFYAFIDKVEYINDNVSQISFTIDVMQTWLFNYELLECFVEREHTETDELFEHILPEPVELGEYVCGENVQQTLFTEMAVLVFTAVEGYVTEEGGVDYRAVQGKITQGMYNGTTVRVFRPFNSNSGVAQTQLDLLNGFLMDLIDANKFDSITSIIMYPYDLLNIVDGNLLGTAREYNISLPSSDVLTSIDGYEPKNKKLFSAPYNFIYGGITSGENMLLEPQFMKRTSQGYTFVVLGNPCGLPSVSIVPLYYKNLSMNFQTAVTSNSFPQCTYTIDAYRAWLANGSSARTLFSTVRNVASAVFEVGRTVASGATSAEAFKYNPSPSHEAEQANAMGSVTGTLLDALFDIGNAVMEWGIAKNLPPTTNSSPNGNSLVAHKMMGVELQQRCINSSVAKMVDDYFTMFGYTVRAFKKPNRNARPHYTYTRTKNCAVEGNAPTDDLRLIEAIFDKGITFWNNGDEVGKYSTVDNSPR